MVEQTSQINTPVLRPRFDLWSLGALVIAVIVLLPILSVVWIALNPTENIWPHLIATTLPRYLSNTLILMAATGVLTAMVGTGAAWLVVMYRFPLHGFLQWALLLPLAIPAYIGAYALVDFLEYAGPVQSGLRAVFGWTSTQDYYFPEIRSRSSAVSGPVGGSVPLCVPFGALRISRAIGRGA